MARQKTMGGGLTATPVPLSTGISTQKASEGLHPAPTQLPRDCPWRDQSTLTMQCGTSLWVQKNHKKRPKMP
jgi:hypothetical protein